MRDLIYMFFLQIKWYNFHVLYITCVHVAQKRQKLFFLFYIYIYICIQLKIVVVVNPKRLNVWKKQTTILVAPILNECIIESLLYLYSYNRI